MTLEREYTMREVAAALSMSERWVRQQVANGAAHQRYGRSVRFTAGQVELLRNRHTQAPAGVTRITVGRGGRRARAG